MPRPIPTERPSLLWSAPRTGNWILHAGLVLEVRGCELSAVELRTGTARWKTTLPGSCDEVFALSPETIAARMPADPRDSLARLDVSGKLVGVDRLESHKPAASWLHADGRGGYIDALSGGYSSRSIQTRAGDGTVTRTEVGEFLAAHEGTILIRTDDATRFLGDGEYEARRDGETVWRLRRRTGSVHLAGSLVLFSDDELWNEWAEQVSSVETPAPRVSVDAYSFATGVPQWRAVVSGPFTRILTATRVLFASGMRSLLRIGLADGTVLPEVELESRGGGRHAIVACDDRFLLYVSSPRVLCVPAGAPGEVAWSFDAGFDFSTVGFEDGVIVCASADEMRAFGVV